MLHGKQTICKECILRKGFHGAMKRALAWSRWPWVQMLAPPELGCVNLRERAFCNKGITSSAS